MKVAQIIALLEKHGWVLSRQKGSHRQFKHTENPNVITVPGNLSDDIPKGTEHQILKKSWLKK